MTPEPADLHQRSANIVDGLSRADAESARNLAVVKAGVSAQMLQYTFFVPHRDIVRGAFSSFKIYGRLRILITAQAFELF
ncbi:hypothetical protein [Sphingopyxis sp. R3-92]|uniref:hypothetical protein n=1 Tax=Sphingopyxis sp. R3-92 TaxID=3158553 RepID=UPI003EE61ADA